MRSLIRRAAIALALLLAGCDFSGRLEAYCRDTANCTCSQGPCCINEGAACEEGLCCDGLACGASGRCIEKSAVLKLSASQTLFPLVPPGFPVLAQLEVLNNGRALSTPLTVTLTGDTDPFTVDRYRKCDGQLLAAGASCKAQITFLPTRGGDFHAVLHVSSGAVESTLELEGTSQARVDLVLNHPGAGARVISDPAGIDCVGGPDGGSCDVDLPLGYVKLTETHDAGTDFSGWSGGGWADACGTSQSCTLQIFDQTTVDATYRPWILIANSISSGWISSQPPGLDCGGDPSHSSCEATLSGPVKLLAHPLSGHTFDHWLNACADAGTSTECDLTLAGAIDLDASFK